jgi:hypothetical protein
VFDGRKGPVAVSDQTQLRTPRRAALILWMVAVIYVGLLVLSFSSFAVVRLFDVPMSTIDAHNEPLTWMLRACLLVVVWLGAKRAPRFGFGMSSTAVSIGATIGLLLGAALWDVGGATLVSHTTALMNLDAHLARKGLKQITWLSTYSVGVFVGSLASLPRRRSD